MKKIFNVELVYLRKIRT